MTAHAQSDMNGHSDVAEEHRLQPQADQARDRRDASLRALHELEDALGAPTPGREQRWITSVVTALDELAAALDEQSTGHSEVDSLLSEIATDDPVMAPRIDLLRREHDDLRHSVASLRTQISPLPDPVVDTADVRERLASVARRLRQHRAREADLIYEAIDLNLGLAE